MVTGYRIPLTFVPYQWRQSVTKRSSEEQTKAIQTAIEEQQMKGALNGVNKVKDQYTSTHFIVKQGTKTDLFSI